MLRNRLVGLLALLASAFVGGAILPSVIRYGATLVHPFLLNWFRISLGFLLLFLFFRKKVRFALFFSKRNLILGLLLGLGLGLNVTMFSFGVSHTTLIASQLIYVFVPIATGLLAYFLLKEKLNRKKIYGMLLAFSGVLLLLIFSRSPEERLSLGTFYGNFLIFVGMFGYSAYLVFSKKLTSTFSVLEMVMITNLSLTILLLPLAIYALGLQGFEQINPRSMWAMLMIALSALLFMGLSQASIKNLSTNTASMGSLLSPEFAALAGIIIYGEKLSLVLLISMILSISGTMLSVSAEKSTFLDRIKLVINRFRIK